MHLLCIFTCIELYRVRKKLKEWEKAYVTVLNLTSLKQGRKRTITPCRLADAVKCISSNQFIIASVSGCRESRSSFIGKNYVNHVSQCYLMSCSNLRQSKGNKIGPNSYQVQKRTKVNSNHCKNESILKSFQNGILIWEDIYTTQSRKT